MTGSLSLSMMLLILFCVLAEMVREVCLKLSADAGPLVSTFSRPATWVGIAFWAIELVAWTFVLENVPLSIAFPLMALSYVAVALAGAAVFKEKINMRHAAGVLLITAGVACVGVTGL